MSDYSETTLSLVLRLVEKIYKLQGDDIKKKIDNIHRINIGTFLQQVNSMKDSGEIKDESDLLELIENIIKD